MDYVRASATWAVVCVRVSKMGCCVRASERATWTATCVRVREQRGLLCACG